nr:MT-A70 family methyltransferase [Gordonia rubripertincta]
MTGSRSSPWTGSPGLGNYLRNATEHLILGTRGPAPVNFRAQPTWMFAPLQDHSHKPEEQYAVIERISSGPYLELFARRRQPGWHAWGNEIDSDIVLPGYAVPSDAKHGGHHG